MIYYEENRNLFSVNLSYLLVQCISADFAMGAGIAVEFNKHYDTKDLLIKRLNGNAVSYWDSDEKYRGCMIMQGMVCNLITKRNYYDKPTYETLRKSLESLRDHLPKISTEYISANKIAMPRIGSGLDKLAWVKVRHIIKEVFKDTDVEILVCYL